MCSQLRHILTIDDHWEGDDARGTGQAFFDNIVAYFKQEQEDYEDASSDLDFTDEADEDRNLFEWWNK